MGYRRKLGWIRVLIAGFVGEVVLIVAVIPFFIVLGEEGAQAPLQYAVPPLCLLMFIPAGWWAARPAVSGHLLIGALVGLVAVVLYMAPVLLADRPITFAYHLGDALKIVGGILGGFIAASRAKAAANGSAAPA